MAMGKYYSMAKNPQSKVNRIIKAADELRNDLEEIERADILTQERSSRELEVERKKVNQLVRDNQNLQNENNDLYKNIELIKDHVKHLKEVISTREESIDNLYRKIRYLQRYKTRFVNRFAKWVKKRGKNSRKLNQADIKKPVDKNC